MGGGSGGNFAPEQFIDQNGKITPQGPLAETDNTMLEIYIWIVQMPTDGPPAAYIGEIGSESFAALRDDHGIENRWDFSLVATTPPDYHGELQPGPAIGHALGVALLPDGETKTVSTWTDTILLVRQPAGGGTAQA
jgi:hypothetical protein